MTEEFKNYLEWFKELDTLEKREELYDQLKYLTETTNELSDNVDVNDSFIDNKILLDLKINQLSEDAYLETLLILVSATQNSLANYNNGMSKLLEQSIKIK